MPLICRGKKSKAFKILVVNIANKPYETFGFKVSDYISTVNKHLGENVFDKVLVNNNFAPEIPKDIKYKYVEIDSEKLKGMRGRIIEGDFLDEDFPVYHDSAKIAAAIDKLSG